jgi:16S rRNA C1402 (ribose-2'-O) methylase RsmI
VPAIEPFAAGRPLAWIDDELDREAEAWARVREAATPLLRSDPGVGLVRRHIKVLERFAYRLGTGVAAV